MDMTSEHENQGRVLIVEDDESAAVFVTRVLERAGFESSWAIDADQASVLLADTNFHVLLTDFRLPGRSGLELVSETRTMQPEIGIAVMTSFNEPDLERRARSRGADDFFEKPLTGSTLVSRIATLVERAKFSGLCPPTSPPARGANVEPAVAVPGVRRGGTPGLPPYSPSTTGCENAVEGQGLSGGSDGGVGSLARALGLTDFADVPAPGPIFRRIGSTRRTRSTVAVWASVTPVVTHVMSGAGPVASPRTSVACNFAR
ncbi:MAG: response regulator [Acidimicrobiales bacterium]|jgi:CheY-like chemotaxis protein